jgi:CubicO group peptidase (beta-lactamase class C family)
MIRPTATTLLIVGLTSTIATVGNASVPWAPSVEATTDQALEAFSTPGAVIVVVTPSHTAVLARGVQCLGESNPMTSNTSLPLASLTKAFTATTAASMVGTGKIAWDTRVIDVIPEFRLREQWPTEHATLRDLLAHRTGLGRHGTVAFNIEAGASWLLDRLHLLEPAGEFRDRATYSSLNYAVAGEMLARIADQPWPEVLSRTILEPIGLDHTTIGPPAGPDTPTGCGHLLAAGVARRIDVVGSPPLAAAEGLWSTGDDVARWIEFLLSEDAPAPATSLPSLQTTWSPQSVGGSTRGPGVIYGFGWRVTSDGSHRMLVHDGGAAGFTAQIRLVPDLGLGVAVIANAAVSPVPDIVAEQALRLLCNDPLDDQLIAKTQAMMRRIDDMRAAQARAIRETADSAAPPTIARELLTGTYRNPAFGILAFDASATGLSARFHDLAMAVEHLHDDTYLLSHDLLGDLVATVATSSDDHLVVTIVLGNPASAQAFDRIDFDPTPESRDRVPVS